MRQAFRILLVVAALGLTTARLFTGIVYEHDDPTTYLVWQRTPSIVIQQENSAAPIRQHFAIIDGDENQLFYQSGYVLTMRWSFSIAILLLLLSVLTLRRRIPR